MIKIALIGFGNVGKSFARVLINRATELTKLGLEPCVIGVLASRGGLINDNCIGGGTLMDLVNKGLYNAPGFKAVNLRDLIKLKPDIAVVSIPPSYRTGEPNLTIYRLLISEGVSVITADKTGLALAYWELINESRARGVFLGFTATVMAGTPVIQLIKGLRGRVVESIEGVLNATSNYVLTLVENGLTMSEAVKKAIEEKIAEPDPAIDLGGLDAAAKATILANVLGLNVSLRDVNVQSLMSLKDDYIKECARRGVRVKQVASISLTSRVLSVKPMEVPTGSVLGSITGNYNALVIRLNDGKEITVIGPTGPAEATAEVMFSDLLEYADLLLTMGKRIKG
ncbi:homoserine dehydrogenase [Caldivirga maquilingensis]|uniref:homoserine dehydrogenase n=1 Tax=Caldivirga maquilingensis (strain ATCC 700844 / DSM 13496 / JCM 10307 / IC-167) TaxID=397948 RepID=A8MCR1_CALMQ|nr:homoserine dehydrogenase [Caldivirga maquilingensis]ABW01567.1 Homoserine dehydrogenase [Caldivirga maquilingensis IC-167]